jgi:RING finger protein 113A
MFARYCVQFMHDRGDYKAGWQLENDWVASQKEKQKAAIGGGATAGEDNYEIHDDADQLPWACSICRNDFVNPVVTKSVLLLASMCAFGSGSPGLQPFHCAASY